LICDARDGVADAHGLRGKTAAVSGLERADGITTSESAGLIEKRVGSERDPV